MIRLFIILISFVLFANLSAQKHLILRSDGTQFTNYGQMYSNEVLPINSKTNKKAIRQFFKDNNTITDYNYILFNHFPIDGAANFGFFGQDWFVQWFEAPSDMTINRAGFNVAAVDASGLTVAVKLVNVNWTKPQIDSAGTTLWGYYQADGNGFGNATAFYDNPDRTGDWVDLEGSGKVPPFGTDIWSDSGNGISIEAIPSGTGLANIYQWVDMSELGSLPVVSQGSIVGVAIKNNSTNLDLDRIGMIATSSLGISGFKFYANGRTSGDTATAGWWTRSYIWDFALDVNLSSLPPLNIIVDAVPTTISNEDRTVTAHITGINPVGNNVSSANLLYSTDNQASWKTVVMTGTEPDYSGIIPGNQSPGNRIFYSVVGINIDGDTTRSSVQYYDIISEGSENLLVFNGYSTPAGYPQGYYFGENNSIINWPHDVWTYGSLTSDLLNNYKNIIYITTNMKQADSNELTVLRNWIDTDETHNLMIAGDEWLEAQAGCWSDTTYSPGDFQYDILGIHSDHSDINYINPGDELLPSEVQPIQGSLLGGQLYDEYNQVSADSNWTNPMMYNPYFEIGVDNWLDGVDFLSDVEVDLTGTAKDGVTKYPIAGHRILPAGNKIAFFAYDPLSLDSDTPEYYWYGFSLSAPQVNVLDWFGITTNIQQIGNELPEKFALSQNYPNPFNPTTTIKYSLPAVETRHALSIQLKIYDVLGREIKTLVNKKQSPGNYQVQFNASGLPSGVYIYRLQAGSFNQSKKMILLR